MKLDLLESLIWRLDDVEGLVSIYSECLEETEDRELEDLARIADELLRIVVERLSKAVEKCEEVEEE